MSSRRSAAWLIPADADADTDMAIELQKESTQPDGPGTAHAARKRVNNEAENERAPGSGDRSADGGVVGVGERGYTLPIAIEPSAPVPVDAACDDGPRSATQGHDP